MLKKLITACGFYFICLSLTAGEGMWLPILLKQLNEGDMQSKGLKLSAEDIYSVNKSSLKDAIVHFGGGCTSEIISSDGLLLTNHHCGYGQIQSHSSVEHDYLTDGYWAMNSSEELPNPGLTATLIKRMEDVTGKILEGVESTMTEEERNAKISENISKTTKAAIDETHYEAVIKPFYEGNAYYMFITETFKDIRLVGAPPSSIGKYGFDTDNWVWPRHTGDFSLFRIYAGKDNKPANYSKDNVPYTPGHYLPINLAGVTEGDFTMVYGFPGRTQEYLTSFAVRMIQEKSDPLKVAIRTAKLDIMDKYMAASDEVRIKYAAKQSRTSNAWKKWKGEIRGLKKMDAIERKMALENRFNGVVEANPDKFGAYVGLLEKFEAQYNKLSELETARDYFLEAGYYGTDLVSYVYRFMDVVNKVQKGEEADSATIAQLKGRTASHFKDYDLPTDRAIFEKLIELYGGSPDSKYKPAILGEIALKYKGDYKAYAEMLYSKSIFVSAEKVNKLLDNWNRKSVAVILKDPAYQLTAALADNYNNSIRPDYQVIQNELDLLSRTYMKALMEVLPDDKQYYPDANSTLRITYGKVQPYQPMDGVTYDYYTTLEGVIEKYNPEVKEFDLPQKLIDLYNKKDFGQYGSNGTQPVCFIASNHTTGGNSGSPVLNGKGELIGLNFDRNWEGTMSDIMYDPDQCRNIAVDIRYVLFIIDKFAGAGYLLEHMDIKK